MYKTKELRYFPVSRWDGKPFKADFYWNDGDETANEVDPELNVVGYSEGKWILSFRSVDRTRKVRASYVALKCENKPRLMTNAELMGWMLDRRGLKMTPSGWVSMIHQYPAEAEDLQVDAKIKVKPEGFRDFVSPTIDLL